MWPYYKESTPFCRKTIINHYRVKQITEDILKLKLIEHYLYLVFCSINLSSTQEGSSWKQIFKPSHLIILIIFAIRVEHFTSIEIIIRGHLSYKTTFTLTQMWPLNTSLTAQWKLSISNLLVTNLCVLKRQMFGFYRLNWQLCHV
jgi:hypothetical protein